MTMNFKGFCYRLGQIHGSRETRKENQFQCIGTLFLICILTVSAAYGGPALGSESFTTADTESVAGSHGLLDGLAFSGPTGTLGMGTDHQEKVFFMDGKLRSLDCEKWGFEQRGYRAQLVGDAVHFEAVHVSDDYGTMTWRGTVREGRLEARYV